MRATPRRAAVGDQTTLADRKKHAGQRLLIGLGASGLTDEERQFIREVRPAGFILFARNVVEPAQVLELNRELTALLPDSMPPFLSVDQEGGRVLRIRDTAWPPMRTLGNIDRVAITGQVARAMADELRAMGFNLNFAPVADVDSNPKNPVIGDRAFGRAPALVARHVCAFMEGLHSHGIIACVKHFPGHGDTSVDSHKDLPVVEKELPELQEMELAPFGAAVRAGIGMVMTSHVLFPALDEKFPATLSPAVLQRLLRNDLQYGGVVISDDLEMKAVRHRWSMAEVLERATHASVDLFCIGRSFEPSLALSAESFDTLVRLQEADRTHHTAANDSVRRIHALKERFFPVAPKAPALSVVGNFGFRMLAEQTRQMGDGIA